MSILQRGTRPQPTTPPRRIVMIDDQPSYTEALTMAFGFEQRLEVVGQATTTKAGVRIALEMQPDLVLCDYRMPGDVSGTECAARLREYGFGGQIVILTGAAAPHVHAEAECIGDVSVISKMLNVDEIIESITEGHSSGMVDDGFAEPWNQMEPSGSQLSPLVQLMLLGLIAIGFLAAAATLLNGGLLNNDDSADTSTRISSTRELSSEELSSEERSSEERSSEERSSEKLSLERSSLERPSVEEVSPGVASADAESLVAGTVLDRPFVIIDGDSGPLRVSVSLDGVEVDLFVPSNLPATVALDVAASTSVRVAVENVGAGGTKSCSIGAARRVFDTSHVGAEGPAVCSAVLAN